MALASVNSVLIAPEENLLGLTLKRYREGRKSADGKPLSQSKLAERAGFDHSYVSRLEAGARTPTRDATLKLARAMELDRVETNDLLASAGFTIPDTVAVDQSEVETLAFRAFMNDETIPLSYRQTVAKSVLTAAAQAPHIRIAWANNSTPERRKTRRPRRKTTTDESIVKTA